MKEKKEYLTEENYEKAKKKLTKLSLIVLIVGLIIGITLISIGVVKKNNNAKENAERKHQATIEAAKKERENRRRLEEMEHEIESYEKIIDKQQEECDGIKMGTESWFQERNKCDRQVSRLKEKQSDLKMKMASLKSEMKIKDYTNVYTTIPPIKHLIFYYIGGFIILASCIISLNIYLISKRREIHAFGVQQTMPIKQETIEKMTPTVGDAAGTIGKDIAKGVTEGIKEGKQEKKK